jgi:hypothetical protein
MKSKILYPFLILALATMACGFNIELPKAQKPGPVVTDKVVVPATGAEETRLKLSFGAGEIKLSPGAEKNLVEGTAAYNYEQFKPIIETNDGDVEIRMGNMKINSFPSFDEFVNTWDFKLGSDPMALTIESGAYDGTYELGGLSLTSLTIKDGAADVELSFSELNPVEMSVFKYETGASNLKLTGLANANFSTLDFSSGAGDYTLDFSGDLQRDASIKIGTGLSNIILVIPQGVKAVVQVDSGVSNVNAVPGWKQNGDTYTQTGDGPTLTFVVDIGAGNLTLSH